MFNLPLTPELIIDQGKLFAMPFILHEQEYDDVLETITDLGPWDTANMYGRFSVKPIIAVGEYGDPVIDVDTATGHVELGVQGIPGLEVSAFILLGASITGPLDPWGVGAYEFIVNPDGVDGNYPVLVAAGLARLNRAAVPLTPLVP